MTVRMTVMPHDISQLWHRYENKYVPGIHIYMYASPCLQAATNVRILSILGPSCRESEVLENAILLENRLPSSACRPSTSRPPTSLKMHPPSSTTTVSYYDNISREASMATKAMLPGNPPGFEWPRAHSPEPPMTCHISSAALHPRSASPCLPSPCGCPAVLMASAEVSSPSAPFLPPGGICLEGWEASFYPPQKAPSRASFEASTNSTCNAVWKESTKKSDTIQRDWCDRVRGRSDGASIPAAGSPSGERGCAAFERPVSVALFESSLQMELRDPFDPDPEGSGLRAEFSCGETQQTRIVCAYGRTHTLFVASIVLSYRMKSRSSTTSVSTSPLSYIDRPLEYVPDEGGPAWTVKDREMQELEEFASIVIGAGVGVVACQRLIHPHLRRRLSKAGVLALERLSALNIAAFQAVKANPWFCKRRLIKVRWLGSASRNVFGLALIIKTETDCLRRRCAL